MLRGIFLDSSSNIGEMQKAKSFVYAMKKSRVISISSCAIGNKHIFLAINLFHIKEPIRTNSNQWKKYPQYVIYR